MAGSSRGRKGRVQRASQLDDRDCLVVWHDGVLILQPPHGYLHPSPPASVTFAIDEAGDGTSAVRALRGENEPSEPLASAHDAQQIVSHNEADLVIAIVKLGHEYVSKIRFDNGVIVITCVSVRSGEKALITCLRMLRDARPSEWRITFVHHSDSQLPFLWQLCAAIGHHAREATAGEVDHLLARVS